MPDQDNNQATSEDSSVPGNGEPTEDTADQDRLSTIDEGEEADEEAEGALLITQFFTQQVSLLTDPAKLKEDPTHNENHSYQSIPIHMMPENHVMLMTSEDRELSGEVQPETESHGNPNLEIYSLHLNGLDGEQEDLHKDRDEFGEYTELCFTEGMAPVILNEQQLEDSRSQK